MRAKRTALHLSMRSVARAVGVTHGALSAYEAGKLKLSAETLERIAEVLGLDQVERARQHLLAVEQAAGRVEFHLNEVARLAGFQP